MNPQDKINIQAGQEFLDTLEKEGIHPILDIKHISTTIDDFVNKKMMTASDGCFLLRFIIQNGNPK